METKTFPCYTQVVYDLLSGKTPSIEMYPEFAQRGHSTTEANAWIEYVKMAAFLNRNLNAHPNAIKEYAYRMMKYVQHPSGRNYVKFEKSAEKVGIKNPAANLSDIEYNAARLQLPNYRLSQSEIDTILYAEQYGQGPGGILLDYCDIFGHKQVFSEDYRCIEANDDGRPDVILVYSGHQQTGHKATELIYRYINNHGKLPEYVFNIGFEDNQNMTDFNPEFEYRKRSEADTYANEEEALGLPREYVRKLWLDPNDTDTWQNINVVASLKKRFGIEECNLIIIGYPVYQLRTATEFAWGLNREDAPNCHITIADIGPKRFATAEGTEGGYDDYRVLSYDQPEYQLADLSLMNCCAHIHLRTSGNDQIRYEFPWLGAYPNEFKQLGAMFMSYSYPNVYSAMLGSEGEEKKLDEEVAAVMKILRYLMLCIYDKGMSGKAMDEQEAWYVKQTAQKLITLGLTSKELIEKGPDMTTEDFLTSVLAYQASKK